MPLPAKDLTGLRVGYLTATRSLGSDGKKMLWEAKCDCGGFTRLPGSELTKQLKRGIVASCGCMRGKTIARRLTTHGMSKHPAYWVWRSMLDRCRLPTHQAWKNYGARGIAVCSEWQSFEHFWTEMGPTYAPGLTLERRDNALGYSFGNCYWATYKAQAANTRSTRLVETPKGPLPACVAADTYGVKRTTLLYRLDHGWPISRALGLSSI